jgi:twinkle protein
METYEKYGIDIPNGKTAGQIYTLCPECSHTRKKNKDKCLSVNLEKRIWHCNHCDWKGFLKAEKVEMKVYVKPVWKNKTELSDNLVKWFEGRGIKQETLKSERVTEGLEYMPQIQKQRNTIQFNYFFEDELINVKYRDGKKNFKMHKDSELIFYRLDVVRNHSKVILVEGEMDALTLVQCGFDNVMSVPNGGNPKNNNLEYLDNCYELFNHVEEIIIATDNDAPGRKLRDDLAHRLGIERCKFLESDKWKDLNDLMISEGAVAVLNAIKEAKAFPLEGVFTIADIDLDIDDMYINGLDTGVETGMGKFDEHIRFVKGYITTVTGIPGHGKSDFVDQICLKLLIKAGWKTAFYSPENKPTQLHFSKLARKLTGKNWFGNNNIFPSELKVVKNFLNEKFWFIKPEKDFTLDTILSHVKQLKRQKGIDVFVIDAWNKLEHKYGSDETKYIGESLDKLALFCEHEQIHCILVAHPRKMGKEKDGVMSIPNLYDISGSANFFNKSDNGLCVYRNFIEGQEGTEVHIQKVKFAHWGQIGAVRFQYDGRSGRFQDPLFPDLQPWVVSSETQSRMEIPANENNVEFDSFQIRDDEPF